jgi:hypothetical protein
MNASWTGLAVVALAAVAIAAPQDAPAVLAGAQLALGGETKLAAVKTIAATGETRRLRADGTTGTNAFELSIELPDKYMKRSVVAAMGPTSIYRQTGFNGDALIDEMDTPPALASGGDFVFVLRRPGEGSGTAPTPEQVAAEKRRVLSGFKQEFAGLAFGMFASSLSVYPVQMKYVGQAEAPDGKADVIEIAEGDGFAARLFVDATSHLPLMLSWQDKEPLEVMVIDDGPGRGGPVGPLGPVGPRGPGRPGPGENVQIFRSEGSGPLGPDVDPAMAERVREAEARRRVVEYRLVYSDYKPIDGIKWPMRIARVVDGQTKEEMIFDRIRVNVRIDPKKFQPSK